MLQTWPYPPAAVLYLQQTVYVFLMVLVGMVVVVGSVSLANDYARLAISAIYLCIHSLLMKTHVLIYDLILIVICHISKFFDHTSNKHT